MAESLPGTPERVHEGGNYAQPAASASALPMGNPLARALNWSGRMHVGSPHGGNPQLDEIFEEFDGQPEGAMSDFELQKRRELKYQFYESLLE